MTYAVDRSKDERDDGRRTLGLANNFHYEPVRGGQGNLIGPRGPMVLPPMPLAVERILLGAPTPVRRVLETYPEGEQALTLLMQSRAVVEHVTDEHGAIVATGVRTCLTPLSPSDLEAVVLADDLLVQPGTTQWTVRCPRVPTVVYLAAENAASTISSCTAPTVVSDLTPIGCLLWRNGMLTAFHHRTTWEMHDAFFHAVTSRGYATLGGYGARPTPRPHPRSTLNLDAGHHLELPMTTDLPSDSLIDVLQRRRCRREHSDCPVDVDTLGVLLQLALRTQRRVPLPNGDYASFHPYGSAGARDELLTVVAHRTVDDAMLYVYDNQTHQLLDVGWAPAYVGGVIDLLSEAALIPPSRASVALLFAADYALMAASYEAIAYANILRNVGGVYQTVGLVAEALGLACCVTGGGWGILESGELANVLNGRVIVGAAVLGWQEGAT